MSTLNTYAPSPEWVANAHVKGEAGYAALVGEGLRRLLGAPGS